MTPTAVPPAARLDRSATVTTALAPLSDRRLAELLDGELVSGYHGIGGPTGTLDVEGVRVFVKQVPVSEPELAHPRSTANLFGLPGFYQYGIGSAGFGAWRELAAHELTTSWVAAGRYEGFPLLHHWRLLPRERSGPDVEERERQVANWDGSEAVRRRLAAVADAPARLVLVLEHWPATVHAWLRERIAADGGADAIAQLDRQVEKAMVAFAAAGFVHFDAHFHNVLTDGAQLCFADFGLAVHETFELGGDEAAFLARHRASPVDPGYDRAYVRGHLVRWLIAEFLGLRGEEADAAARDVAAGKDVGLPAAAAAVVGRHAPVAVVMQRFLRELWAGRTTPYPADELRNLYRRD